MVYTHHQNSQQLNLLDPTAVAENRIAGGVGEVTGAIPLPRPDSPEEVITKAKATPLLNSFQFNVFPLTGALLCQLAQSYS